MLGLSPGSRAVDPVSDAAAAVLAAAVAQLRQAAGVYDYLAKQVLPSLFLTIKGDRWVCAGLSRVQHNLRLISCSGCRDSLRHGKIETVSFRE